MLLLQYFKVDKCVKADSDAVLPNSSGPLVQNILASRIDATY